MRTVNIPNLVTLVRIFLVPLVVWLIAVGSDTAAFWVFLCAGVSDAVDGFLARRWKQQTLLGTYLDPVADKLLLVSVYVTLGIVGALPRWLVILVVFRDVIIVGGLMLAWLVERPMPMQPLLVSKANTLVQISFAALVLAARGYDVDLGTVQEGAEFLVAALTVSSAAAYLAAWMRHLTGTAAID
jgi:cardiolipin synthase